MTNNKYQFTKDQIVEAASTANSKTEMMRLLKIKQGGGGYQALEKWCRLYDVMAPTMSSEESLSIGRKNGARFTKMSDEEWFINGTFRNGQSSKGRLIDRGTPNECSICSIGPEWNGKTLTLQLDHVNGDRFDNLIENLRILCPNCHTQTETYANTGAEKRRTYCECGKEIWKGSTSCKKCAQIGNTVADYPSVEDIVTGIIESNYTSYAKSLGVSDNAVRKYLRVRGVDPKTLTCKIKV